MKRLLHSALIALALIALSGHFLKQARAFAPPNNRYIDQIGFNRVIPDVILSGVLKWQAVDFYGWPGWRSTVAFSLDQGSSYAQSEGNVLGLAVREVQLGETADLSAIASTPGVTSASCGGAFATACTYIYDPLPVRQFYNAGSMASWPFTSNAAVIEHETFHDLSNACDQYRGGCPPTDSEWFTCTSNPDTLMDCGGAARYPQPFDIESFRGVYVVPPIGGVFNSTYNAVFYGGAPGPGLAGVNACARTTVHYWSWPRGWFWSGQLGSCLPGFQAISLPNPPSCAWVFVGGENASAPSWAQNLTFAGATRCP